MAKLFSVSSAISQRPLRLKALSRRLTIIVHHPFDALPKENHVEIDQQANWNIEQPEVRQKLSLINRHLSSTTTLSSTTRSARKPQSNFTDSYTSGTAFCRSTRSPSLPSS